MKDIKVAIIQNKIHKGGRFQVIVNMAKTLNKMDVVPDIITFDSQIDSVEFQKNYNTKIDFNLKEIRLNCKMPYKINIVLFNLTMRKFNKSYDLFINSSNSSLFLSKNINLISYIHYPQKDRIFFNKESIHFPETQKKNLFSINGMTDIVLRLFYRFDKLDRKDEVILANSDFTKSVLLKNYPDLKKKDIDVLYPPIQINSKLPRIKKDYSLVVSMGRFCKIKRQLEQIKIAQQLPEYDFKIIGFKKQRSAYFGRCQRLISLNNISNVELIPNASYKTMQEILIHAGFFIHSTRNEPFGISPAQAINNGTIPVVHNSGGQKEVVPIEELRYNDIEEAILLFKNFTKSDKQDFNKIKKKLFLNLQNYSQDYFHMHFENLLKKKMDTIK